jgi:hypothetical protein
MSRVHRLARTGFATASSRRTRRPASSQARARARRTVPSTAAMPDGASWSPASGPARRSRTTGPTGRPGWSRLSAWICLTRPATPGLRSPRLTRITCRQSTGCCTSSPIGPGGKAHSTKPDEKPGHPPQNFRQLMGERSDGRWRHDRAAHYRGSRGTAARVGAHRAMATPGGPICALRSRWAVAWYGMLTT